jgi:hypothetical protein
MLTRGAFTLAILLQASLANRVPISGDTPAESPNSPRQRPLSQICGRGENRFPAGDAQFAAKISVGKFGATVWELRRRTTICGSIGFALTSSFRLLVPARSKAEEVRSVRSEP